jgi:hypothetical protein
VTVQGRDASNFDVSISFSGLGFFTHKATEGTSIVHDKYGARLAAARAAGVPVLGAYHVLRTGNLAQQLNFWLGYLDAHTPWWRTHPNFLLQVDAERWPYDDVSASTVLSFGRLLAGAPGYHVTYASRGQYGDSLRGLPTALWNADYRGSSGGSYPGDGWVSSGGQPAGWAAYSGQVPVFLQYTDSPYDKDAYRGSLDQLLAQTAQNGAAMTQLDDIESALINEVVAGSLSSRNALFAWLRAVGTGQFPTQTGTGLDWSHPVPAPFPGLTQVSQKIDALTATVNAGGGNVDTAAILARLDALAQQVAATQAEVHQLRTQLAKAEQAAADALKF